MLIKCIKNLIASTKSSVYLLLLVVNVVFLASCGSSNALNQKVSSQTEKDCYNQSGESYCGRGEYITYDDKRDIILGEINGIPSIYFSDMKMEKDIIYTNSECYGMYQIALQGEWIYFTERFGELRENMRHYISRVKIDGTEYKRIRGCKAGARMLTYYKGSIYYKDLYDEKVKAYNIKKDTEKEIANHADEIYVSDGKIYIFDHLVKDVTVKDIDTEETKKVSINQCFTDPIVRKNEIYYVKYKSNDYAFHKNDVYYICKMDMSGKEKILYETTDYIFSFVVIDETILVSQGKKNAVDESFNMTYKSIPHAKLIEVQLDNSKKTVVRDDLSYDADIYSTLNKVYFSVDEWNGKRWIERDESTTVNN